MTINSNILKSVSAAAFYAFMSGAMAFMNKNLMTNYNFDCPMFILLIQFLVLVSSFEFLKAMRLIKLTSYNLKLGLSMFFTSLCYIASSSFALLCLGNLNIPMYNVLKRLCPLFNVILGHVVLQKYHISGPVLGSVIVITIGSILAGYGDLSFTVDAYVYGILSAVAQSVYLLLVQKAAKEDNLSVLDISYIVAVNAFPLCFLAIFIFGEFSKLQNFHGWHMKSFGFHFTLVTFCGTLLVYSQFLCTAVTTALTTSLSSSIKSVLTTIIGLFTFGGVHVTSGGGAGIFLNTVGGLAYTFLKYSESSGTRKSNSNGHVKHSNSHNLKSSSEVNNDNPTTAV